MTTDVLRGWLCDLPAQFLGKKNIEVLIRAFARQMKELYIVFEELITKTGLDLAMGQNLDYLGTIIPLTRKEAGELVNQRFQEPVISDWRYRQYLRYKMLRNTSDCTYYDIMKAIEILWDVNKADYYERADRPATIFIGLPMVDAEEEDQAKGKPSIMKPAGVGFYYTARYYVVVDQSGLEKVEFDHMEIQAFFHYFKRILNGGWLLDGSVSLGQIPICEIDLGVMIGNIDVTMKETPCVQGLDIRAMFPMTLRHWYSMEIGHRFDSTRLQMALPDVEINLSARTDTVVRTEGVTIEKDLWRLDGRETMDGSRILDAAVWEEEL